MLIMGASCLWSLVNFFNLKNSAFFYEDSNPLSIKPTVPRVKISEKKKKKKSFTSPYDRLADRHKLVLPQGEYFEGHNHWHCRYIAIWVIYKYSKRPK